MIYLLDSELAFIDRTMVGPLHIAHKQMNRPYHWQTFCGRVWHRDGVSQMTVRESEHNDPDSFVCKRCVAHAPDGAIREE